LEFEKDSLGRKITTGKFIYSLSKELEAKLNEVLETHYKSSPFTINEIRFKVHTDESGKLISTASVDVGLIGYDPKKKD